MGSSSGGSQPSGEQTVTTSTEVPAWYQPSLQAGLNRTEALYGQGQPALPGFSQVPPMAPQTLDALMATEMTARGGIPGMHQAYGNWADTLGGQYMAGSPGFDAAMDAMGRSVRPQIQSQFETAGRGNSALADVGIAQAMSDAYASLFNAERGRQMQGLAMAPQMEALAYQGPARLAAVGGALEGQYGAELGSAYDRDRYNALAPQTSLDQFIARVQGINPGGGTQTQTTPLYQNRGAGALGGAMAGAGFAEQLGGMFPAMAGPWGMGLGAIGGGLLGAFG